MSSILRRIKKLFNNLGKSPDYGQRASMKFVAIAAVIFCIFLIGGGIYDLLENPPSILPGPGDSWIAIHPYMGEQTLNESFVNMVLNSLTFVGMVLALKSTQIVYDSKRANTMLIISLVLILLGSAGNHFLMVLKRNVASG
jgi:hypothetical protein